MSSSTPMSASSANTLMAGSLLTNSLTSFGGAYAQSRAISAQGAYQANLGKLNAQLADYQAEDAQNRGTIAVKQHQMQTKQLIGAQRASFAAQGLDVSSGSAADVQSSTEALSKLDEITIRTNAFREAMGYRSQAIQATASGQMAGLSANANANSTLLTGGLQAVNYGARAGYYFAGGSPVGSLDRIQGGGRY